MSIFLDLSSGRNVCVIKVVEDTMYSFGVEDNETCLRIDKLSESELEVINKINEDYDYKNKAFNGYGFEAIWDEVDNRFIAYGADECVDAIMKYKELAELLEEDSETKAYFIERYKDWLEKTVWEIKGDLSKAEKVLINMDKILDGDKPLTDKCGKCLLMVREMKEEKTVVR